MHSAPDQIVAPLKTWNECTVYRRMGGGPERRTSPRFQTILDLRYTVMAPGPLKVSGRGHTLDISSSGVCFRSDRPLSLGQKIDAAIHWPVQLFGSVALQLIISGVVVRTEGKTTVVKIHRYEFKTRRGARDAA